MSIKSWIAIIAGIILTGLIATVSMQSARIRNLDKELSYSRANEKALYAERDSLEDNSRTLYLTVEQLNQVNDSIIQKMNGMRRELGIKDKEIQQLQYQLSEASKKDTIVFRDTLFRDPELQIDTTIGDKWYNIRLGLEYPSTIAVTPSFTSERYVNMYLKKETVNPPKKCFIARWFQKRHLISVVEVTELNPYIKIKEQRYIKAYRKRDIE